MLRTWILALALLVVSAISVQAEDITLVVAHDSTWPPMEYMDKDRNIVGYSVDYIDAVAKEAGFKVEHKSVAWDGIFSGLASKRYDVISSSVTITDERKRIVDFSDPYYTVKQAAVTLKDSSAASMADFKGKSLGAQIGTTGFMAVKKAPGVKSMSFDEIGLAMQDLASGRLDGVVCDDSTAINFVLANEEYSKNMKVAFILPVEKPEFYGFAVAKGNTKAVELLNKGIAAVKEKGIEDQLIKKWTSPAGQ